MIELLKVLSTFCNFANSKVDAFGKCAVPQSNIYYNILNVASFSYVMTTDFSKHFIEFTLNPECRCSSS